MIAGVTIVLYTEVTRHISLHDDTTQRFIFELLRCCSLTGLEKHTIHFRQLGNTRGIPCVENLDMNQVLPTRATDVGMVLPIHIEDANVELGLLNNFKLGGVYRSTNAIVLVDKEWFCRVVPL